MTLDDLMLALGRDEEWVTARVEEGLPFRSIDGERDFNPSVVQDWLIDNGFAQRDDARVIVSKVKEVAEHFNVSTRTVQNWKDGGMPWSAGRFDLLAIAEWREAEKGASQKQEELQERGAWETQLARFKAERAKLEYEELLGTVIKADAPKRIIVQMIHAIRTHLEQFPDRLAGLFTYPVERTAMLNTTKLAVTDLLRTIQQQIKAAGDDLEESDQGEAA